MSPPASALAAEQFAFLTEATWTIEAVEAASSLGVLDRLEVGSVTAGDLTTHCGITPRHSRLLLSALVGLGIAEKIDTTKYRGAVSGFNRLAPRLLPNGRLTAVLSGAPQRYSADTPAGSQQLYPGFVRFLAGVLEGAAEKAADLLARSDLRVIDAGAGAAPWSLAIAARHPSTRVMAVDLPDVIPVTQTSVTEAGLDDIFEYQTGDIFQVDLGLESFDLAIAGGLCHLFDEATNMRLLSRLATTLRPGGTLAIIEPLPNEHLDGPLPVTLYALGLLTRTAGGGVYPFSTYVEWLRKSGFRDIGRSELSDAPPISLITAQRGVEGGPS